MSDNRQHRRAWVGIIVGTAISWGSILLGILGILYGLLDILGSVMLYLPGCISGILFGGFISGFAGVVGVLVTTASLLGYLYFFLSITPSESFDALGGAANGLIGGTISGIAFIVVIGFLINKVTTFGGTREKRRVQVNLAVRAAGQLLPAAVREGHIEEWCAWLRDLRESGEPWHRRCIELLSIVFVAAPKLAIALRLWRRRAVD